MAARNTGGTMMIAGGWVISSVGFMLSLTGVGAVCGVPMIIASIPVIIWGHVLKSRQAEINEEKFQERILETQATAEGINICPMCKAVTPNTQSNCNACGFEYEKRNTRNT